jgi:type VI secretion system protein ImpA
MASAPTIDIDALLAPISDESPAGAKIRDDSSPTSVYLQLKDARAAARAAERRAEAAGEPAGALAEWDTIFSLAPTVLAEQSKDLEVSAWLVEALIRLEGFAGLRDGFGVVRGLVEQYWDELYSLEDEEGVVTKVAPLTGLNGLGADGTLIQPMRMVPLTGVVGDEGPFSAYHYEQATNLAQVSDPDARARQADAGAVTVERFTTAVNATGAAYYVDLIEDLEGAAAEFERLTSVLYEKAGRDAPPASNIRDLLGKILDATQSFSKDLISRYQASGDGAEPQSDAGIEAAADAAPGAAVATGPIRGREDALRTLAQVADYFHKTEPHSPIASTLEDVVRRARMPFSELLRELLGDETAWRSALNNAGIRPPEHADE